MVRRIQYLLNHPGSCEGILAHVVGQLYEGGSKSYKDWIEKVCMGS